MDETADLPETLWANAWNKHTPELAYEACKDTRQVLSEWADSLDTKLLAVLGAGGVLLTIGPALKPPSTSDVSLLLWCLAVVCWFIGVAFGVAGYRPASLRVGPQPRTLLRDEWLRLEPYEFCLRQIEVLTVSYEFNVRVLKRKAGCLGYALVFTAAEVVFLAVSLILAASAGVSPS